MKKNILSLLLAAYIFNVKAQDSFPSYPKIVKTYFKLYAKDDDYEHLLNLAKKKDGWYYQRLNASKSNQLIEEEKFWTPENGYNPNIKTDKKEEADSDKINTDAAEYLTSTSNNPWYGYERCRYFGYTGWEYDMIRDYGKADNLTDTLLEGLAKAYSSIAISYLWYQQGGAPFENDTLQRQLDRLELPSAGRLAKVDHYLEKATAVYERLKQQNPSHVCLVGNVSLKKFNETMNGYMQMIMSLQKEKAVEYLNRCTLEREYIMQAKNYLNSCDSNAIIFTYGDNDTYQLWYVQEKENYRKDVAVINTSLLGLAIYIDMLKKNKTVSFNAGPAFYGKKESDVAYYEKESPRPMKKELHKFLTDIYNFKKTKKYTNTEGIKQSLNAYNVKDLAIRISPAGYNKYSSLKTTDTIIRLSVKNYLQINDALILDIIATNINSRPIYFTSTATGFFDSSLVQQGIIFKLFPKNKFSRQLQLQEIKKLEKFADNIYKPVITFKANGATHFCIDGNNTFFQLYSKIAGFYKEKKDDKTVTLWLDKAFKISPSVSNRNFPGAYSFIPALQNENKKKLTEFCETYAAYCFDKYSMPLAREGYMDKDECIKTIDGLLQTLQDEDIESDYIDELISQLYNSVK